MRKLLTLLTLTIAAALFAVGCSGQPSRNAPRDGRSTTTDVGQDDIVGLKMVRDALEKNAEYKDRVKAVEDSLAKSDEPSGKKDGGGEASEAEVAAAFDGAMDKAVEAGLGAMSEGAKVGNGKVEPVLLAIGESFKASLGDKLSQAPEGSKLFAAKQQQALAQCVEKMPAEFEAAIKTTLASAEVIATIKQKLENNDSRANLAELFKMPRYNAALKAALGESADLKAALDEAAGKYPEIKAALGG